MKTKILLILLFISVVFLSAYERDQVSRYAHRYTRLTEDANVGINPDSLIWHNVNPFIYQLERQKGASINLAGYWDGADCAHFVSQCMQAGGIPMHENGYYDNSNFLGYVNCKNLHNFSDTIADSLRMTFHDSLWITEVIEPNFENVHNTSTNYDRFFHVPREIRLLKFHFTDFDLHPGYPPYSPDRVTIGYYPFWYNDLVYTGNQGDFWTTPLYRYAWLQHSPQVHIEYHPDWSGYYGFQMNLLKWQAFTTPDSDYQQGDFQIFCNYRTDNVDFVNAHEIFYESTYNDTGRTIRYKHAVICRSGSGNTARVSAHNNDRNDSLWSYSYCPDSAVYNSQSLNSISFYHINDGAGDLPNLCAYNNWGNKSLITTSHPDSIIDKNTFEVGDPIYIKYAFQNDGGVMIPDRFQVRVEFENTRTLIDSVLYDGIFSGSNIIDTLFNPLIMPDIDSLTISIHLDAGDSLDYGADWERTWGEQHWHETNETDNIISKTIYLNTGLQPPTNLEIEVTPNRGTIDINWDGNNRSTYKVYSSTNPYNNFEEDLSGVYDGTSWSAPLPIENMFYYVVETDGRGTTRSKQVHYRKAK